MMRFEPEVYQLAFFTERGFTRHRCRVCGEFFWSLDPEATVCGDAPCTPYAFIGSPPTSSPYSLREMRRAFLSFFERRGHRVIEPYPVVPRWRRDLYLVSASIVDFQPYVTSGMAEPPANPLVISQPCIRLVDIDKVGPTMGRHLTSFEMGGAHAFNSQGRGVYWKDETVAYCHEFLGELGVEGSRISYKESSWMGGGNAGPCFEVLVGGLEVATLVFMQYRTDGQLEETPIKTVDTGYGIERLAWLSRGTPSAFEVVHEEVLPKALRMLGGSGVDIGLLSSYARYSAWVQPTSARSLREARREAAQLAGVRIEEVEEELRRLERIYAALDFTKSIVFITADGVVPSNSKVGYLSRLLIRRAYGLLSALRSPELLLDLVELQVRRWGEDFRKIAEMREEILDIVEVEVRRFGETIERGRRAVERELGSLKSSGSAIGTDFFVRMYDEKGITPDIVADAASRFGLEVRVPENIYELVAEMHLQERPEQAESRQLLELEALTRGLPPTRRAYYESPFASEFSSTVLRVGRGVVILDSTLFYPEGGGQVGDTGEIHHARGVCRVVDTQLVGDVVVHLIEGEPPREGELIRGVIDFDRRLSIMRHHTSTHILLGAARRVLGKHAWQMGARKEPDKSRLDISHHRRLSREEIRRMEREANEVVKRRIPVSISWMERSEAERTHGFYLYQGGEVPLGVIRVVNIPGWDAEACGGLHCENTEDVGLIKIIRTERIQDGVERLIFASGPAALPYIEESFSTLEDVAGSLSTPPEKLRVKVDETLAELRSLRKTVKELGASLASLKGEALASKGEDEEGVRLILAVEELSDKEYLIDLALASTKIPTPAVALIVGKARKPDIVVKLNEEAIRLGLHAGRIASLFCERLGGKGGGKEDMGQGGAPSLTGLEDALNAVRELIRTARRA